MKQSVMILYNGQIHTMDPRRPLVDRLAVTGGRIAAVGDEVGPVDGPITVDLGGRTVIPGLIDSHIHFVWYCMGQRNLDLRGATSLSEALAQVAAQAAVTPSMQWIRGGRWDCNLWGGQFPTRYDLDRVAPEHAVMLASKDGHSIWVNSRALELAQVSAQTADVPGGRIFRDTSGEPTGILQENAMDLVYRAAPPPSVADMVAACRAGVPLAHQVGLTGIHDCEGSDEFAAFQELERQGELTLRVLMHIPAENLDAAIAVGLRDGFGHERLRLHGVKLFADGALGSRSAWMLHPYEGDADNRGVPTLPAEELADRVRRANRAGLSVAVHAIGDAANRAVLDAIEQQGVWSLRNRIEHVQLLHPDDAPRLARLGVTASMQPIHATSDMDIADRHWGERAAAGYAWRSLLLAGAVLAFGSDAPVEDWSPLRGIHAAVTRRRPDGTPGAEGWYPAQRISVTEAVHAYTMGAAWAGGEEQIKGSLMSGKLADLVVLDRDIWAVDPMDIGQTQVVGTMVGGQWVYGEWREAR